MYLLLYTGLFRQFTVTQAYKLLCATRPLNSNAMQVPGSYSLCLQGYGILASDALICSDPNL